MHDAELHIAAGTLTTSTEQSSLWNLLQIRLDDEHGSRHSHFHQLPKATLAP